MQYMLINLVDFMTSRAIYIVNIMYDFDDGY